MSIAENKNINHLLNLLINCISTRSATHVLSLKGECTFLLSNFLVIILHNSSGNLLLEIFSFLTVPHGVFLSKKP